MLVWLTLPFYNFCGFWSVAVNTVYKLQFFYIYTAYSRAFLMDLWTSTYMPNFIKIEKTFCGRTDVRTHVGTDGRTTGVADGRTFETGLIRSTLSKSRPNNAYGTCKFPQQ